ncbi:MAG: hypothetical protein JXB39_02955 [Deltaproteobacteria bacterium]|nr:hypothetical protein [Deltaproteobacteria bacterium]
MGFADLFRPKWKHSDPKVRIEAIKMYDHLVPVWDLATADPDPSVRKAVLEETMIATVMAHVLLHDADVGVRQVAARRLADVVGLPEMFAEVDEQWPKMPKAYHAVLQAQGKGEEACHALVRQVLDKEADPEVRAAVVPLLKGDEKGMVALAISDPSPQVGGAVLEELDDRETALRIALKAPAATALMAVRHLDNDGLARVASSPVDETVRRAAVERLDDDDGLVRVAQSDAPADLRLAAVQQMRYEDGLETLARKGKDPEVRVAAFERYLTMADEDEVKTLSGRLLGDADPRVRTLAVRHTDQTGRAEKLARSDPDEQVRLAALERVVDPTVASAIAAQDASPAVREAAAKAVNQPWKEKAARYRDWEDPQRWKVVRAFAGEVSSRFPKSQVVLNQDEEEIYVRGSLDDVPIQIGIWATFGSLSVSMRWESPLPDIDLTRDLTKKPVKARGDVWGEKDEVRLFLGPAIFVEGRRDDAQAMAAAWGVLPPEATEPVIDAMTRLDLSFAYFQSEEAKASFEKSFYEMDDPVGAVLEMARILVDFFKAVKAAPLPAAIPALEAGDCSYCGARFNKLRRSTCPNCGAPVAW